MRFSIEQNFAADVDDVARAYADPELDVALVGLPKLTEPEVVGHQIDGDLRVKALLVAGAVEGAIVSGLKEHLVDEAPVVAAFVNRSG